MVLLEAKAYGLPIVSFDCPTGPSEIIEDALNGNLVRPDDISGMAESVNRLIEDRAIRERYALHAGDGDGRFAKETIICTMVYFQKSLSTGIHYSCFFQNRQHLPVSLPEFPPHERSRSGKMYPDPLLSPQALQPWQQPLLQQ